MLVFFFGVGGRLWGLFPFSGVGEVCSSFVLFFGVVGGVRLSLTSSSGAGTVHGTSSSFSGVGEAHVFFVLLSFGALGDDNGERLGDVVGVFRSARNRFLCGLIGAVV